MATPIARKYFLSKEGNLLGSTESIPHTVSADFKTTRRKACKKQQFPMRKRNSNSVNKDVLWHQIIGNPERFVYKMITKARYFQNRISKVPRASLLALKGHAETKNVNRFSMFRVGFRLDQLDWQKIQEMIQDMFNCPTVQVKSRRYQQSENNPTQKLIWHPRHLHQPKRLKVLKFPQPYKPQKKTIKHSTSSITG